MAGGSVFFLLCIYTRLLEPEGRFQKDILEILLENQEGKDKAVPKTKQRRGESTLGRRWRTQKNPSGISTRRISEVEQLWMTAEVVSQVWFPFSSYMEVSPSSYVVFMSICSLATKPLFLFFQVVAVDQDKFINITSILTHLSSIQSSPLKVILTQLDAFEVSLVHKTWRASPRASN